MSDPVFPEGLLPKGTRVVTADGIWVRNFQGSQHSRRRTNKTGTIGEVFLSKSGEPFYLVKYDAPVAALSPDANTDCQPGCGHSLRERDDFVCSLPYPFEWALFDRDELTVLDDSPPIFTCKMAADQFREWGKEESMFRTGHCAEMADILVEFGDAPLPESIRNRYKFDLPK